MEGNQDIIKIKSSKKNLEGLSIKKKREEERLEAKKKRDQIAKKEGEQSLAELVSGNLDEIAAGSKKKIKVIDSEVREIASDSENQEVVKQVKQAGEDTKAQMQDAEDLASQDIKKKNLALNQSKAEEIIEEIGLLDIKKNNGEDTNYLSEEAKKADKLARAIENSKYIKEQEQLLTELSSMYESYKNVVYGNESNKIISEIHKLSQKDENNGKQYRDKVNSIIQSEDVEKINNGLKQLLEELKVKQDSKEPGAVKEIAEDKETVVEEYGWDDVVEEVKEDKKKLNIEKEKIYKITDKRELEMELKEGDEIYLNDISYKFNGITKEGKMVLDDGKYIWHPKNHIIAKTKEAYNDYEKQRCEYNLDQITESEGVITDKRGEEMELKEGDEIYLNDYLYKFNGITKEGNMVLDDGKHTLRPKDYIIAKTKEAYNDYEKQRCESSLAQIAESKGTIIDERELEMELKEGDEIYLNDYLYKFNGITKEGNMVLDDGKHTLRPKDYIIAKTEKETIVKEEEVINLTDEIKKEDVWIIELSEDKAEQETIKKLFEYILERARKVDVYEGFNENALKRIAIDQTKESYNKYK